MARHRIPRPAARGRRGVLRGASHRLAHRFGSRGECRLPHRRPAERGWTGRGLLGDFHLYRPGGTGQAVRFASGFAAGIDRPRGQRSAQRDRGRIQRRECHRQAPRAGARPFAFRADRRALRSPRGGGAGTRLSRDAARACHSVRRAARRQGVIPAGFRQRGRPPSPAARPAIRCAGVHERSDGPRRNGGAASDRCRRARRHRGGRF